MPPGQPTKYKEEYATEEFLQKFIDDCHDKELLVSLCGLACYVKVTEETIQEWKRKHPEFSVCTGRIKQISKQMLCNNSLKGSYNSNIAKLLLSATHGVSEKTTTEHVIDKETATLLGLIDGKDKGQLPDQEVEEAGE